MTQYRVIYEVVTTTATGMKIRHECEPTKVSAPTINEGVEKARKTIDAWVAQQYPVDRYTGEVLVLAALRQGEEALQANWQHRPANKPSTKAKAAKDAKA